MDSLHPSVTACTVPAPLEGEPLPFPHLHSLFFVVQSKKCDFLELSDLKFDNTHVTIDLDIISENFRAIREKSGVPAMAVVKADAYGHGAVRVARALEPDCAFFCVSSVAEAVELRQAGIVKPVLILGHVHPTTYPAVVLHDIRIPIFNYEDACALSAEALKQDKKILLEGQLGTMKDPDMGIYPMVTSSSTLAGYGCVGAGIPPYEIKKIVVVTKAYSSSVGGGAFVSEILDEAVAKELRDRGGDKGEYGATTGRPRRVGWFDCVATRYGVRLQGGTDVALTNLDVLGYLDKIPVCTAYEIDGEITKDFPNPTLLDRCKPVIEYLPSWKGKGEIRGLTEYDKLPKEAQDYVEFIEKEIGVHVSIVSTGPVREEIIRR